MKNGALRSPRDRGLWPAVDARCQSGEWHLAHTAWFDAGESLSFSFDGPAFTEHSGTWISLNGVGLRLIEAFDADGVSLGTAEAAGGGAFDFNEMFGDSMASGFTIAETDEDGYFTLSALVVELLACPDA